jgi:hypothetical protein
VRNGTDDLMTTDGRMVTIGLKDCGKPRFSTETVDATPVPEHGGCLQRLARREILSARNELLRTNRYWRAYEGGLWVINSIRRRKHQTQGDELLSDWSASTLTQFARNTKSRID